MTDPKAYLRTIGSSPAPAGLTNNNFDALRLIFALMVVIFHAGLLSQEVSLSWTRHVSATFAVQAFFVVSGFLVTMSCENSSSLGTYFLKRTRRIAPAYIVVVVGCAILLSFVSNLSLRDYLTSPATWRYALYNLALSNFSAPDLPGVFTENYVTAVNGSLWTIKIEVAFYCVVPLIVMLGRRFGTGRVLAAVIFFSIIWKIGFEICAIKLGSDLCSRLAKQLPGQLSFFAGGAWAYYRTRGGNSINGLYALAGVILYAIGGNLWFDSLLAPLCVTAIVYWAAVCAPRLPAVGKHGDISYGVYLYHFPLIQTLIAVHAFHRWPIASSIALLLVVPVLAMMSWKIIEEPWLRRRTHA